MGSRWSIVLVLAVSILGTVPTASAQEIRVTLAGSVFSAEGAPIGGAAVVARGEVERGVVTDDDGSFRLGPLPAGTYTLRVDAIGYRSIERELNANTATATVDFVMEPAPVALAPLQVIATTRGGASAASLPIKVEVISEREVELQQSFAANPTEILSNLIPSFSPGRQKLTSSGESFRGRRPLFLVDGVPQSNPLRDGRRDGFTIDMEVIERIEVIFGANAIQGLGATGGIVNYVTVSAPLTGELEQRASLSTTSNDGFDENGIGWRAHYLAAKRFGDFDVLGSVSYQNRGLQFDALNRPIGIDNVQGDVSDSHSYNFFGKFGWDLTAAQRLQLTVNDFLLEQEGNFDSLEGDRSLSIPAIAVEGDPEGIEPINDVTMVALDYEHTELSGGSLSAKAYYQDFRALYGGGRFATFQDPRIAPIGEVFDQSENNSEKFGTRLTYARAGIAGAPIDLITGFDFLRDKTFQRLALTDRNWVPETEFFNYAPFVQLDVQPLKWLSLSGGLRWEIAMLDVADFTTLAGNRDDFERVEVAGGSPSFDEPLFNIGGVLTPIEGLRIYGTFSQAYTMPDVGRVLRGISTEGTAVEDFLDLTPIKTFNREVGGTYGTAQALLGLTYFESEADFGSRLVPNADGIFKVHREPTLTSGWEVTGRYRPARQLSLSAGYSMLDGSYDGDDDGVLESDLGAADIGPDRLNLAIDLIPGGRFRGRVQSFTYFDETFEDGSGDVTARFDGYSTVDSSIAADFGFSTITLSVANILDEQYISYYSQAATDRNDRYFAGRGRTFTLRVESRF
ncbi:MAG TPA: TonB-dependent receptor [Longimicrobiaceae bacterium]|nr:TonB-dependent receptor [Longimicrobiaceae bacterium]